MGLALKRKGSIENSLDVAEVIIRIELLMYKFVNGEL